jgi:Protein of unknown function (DUF1524)/Excalibur calcium-binding domain
VLVVVTRIFVGDPLQPPAEPEGTRPHASAGAPSHPTTPPDLEPTDAPSHSSTRTPQGTAAGGADTGSARTILAAVAVKGRAPKAGYDRDRFGPAWSDVDRNGCDTRNDILRRDLDDVVLRAGTSGCLVLQGTLRDPYTGRTVSFVRGAQSSASVQVDHVVALSDAWQKGAQAWDAARRETFANDPLNLLAVDGPTNVAKGDGDAASWLPPDRGYRCAYVARQVAVKDNYGLWMTPAEKGAVQRVLAGCPTQGVPSARHFSLGAGQASAASQGTPHPDQSRTAQSLEAQGRGRMPNQSGTDPDAGTCKAAKAAGYGPYYEGRDVEYVWYQDRDHDGVVCE